MSSALYPVTIKISLTLNNAAIKKEFPAFYMPKLRSNF